MCSVTIEFDERTGRYSIPMELLSQLEIVVPDGFTHETMQHNIVFVQDNGGSKTGVIPSTKLEVEPLFRPPPGLYQQVLISIREIEKLERHPVFKASELENLNQLLFMINKTDLDFQPYYLRGLISWTAHIVQYAYDVKNITEFIQLCESEWFAKRVLTQFVTKWEDFFFPLNIDNWVNIKPSDSVGNNFPEIFYGNDYLYDLYLKGKNALFLTEDIQKAVVCMNSGFSQTNISMFREIYFHKMKRFEMDGRILSKEIAQKNIFLWKEWVIFQFNPDYMQRKVSYAVDKLAAIPIIPPSSKTESALQFLRARVKRAKIGHMNGRYDHVEQMLEIIMAIPLPKLARKYLFDECVKLIGKAFKFRTNLKN